MDSGLMQRAWMCSGSGGFLAGLRVSCCEMTVAMISSASVWATMSAYCIMVWRFTPQAHRRRCGPPLLGDGQDGTGNLGSSDRTATTSLFCCMIMPPRTRTTKHEDGAKLLERPDLGFDGVGGHPP